MRKSSRSGAPKRLECVGGDRRAGAVDLDARHRHAVDARHGTLRHPHPVRGRRDDQSALLPWVTRGDEHHLVQSERGTYVDRDDDVTVVRRIEGAAEDPEARHRTDATHAV